MRRLAKVILGVCFVLTVIHLGIKHESLDPRKLMNAEGYFLKPYHSDANSHLMVVEKARGKSSNSVDLRKIENFVTNGNKDYVNILEGYDYAVAKSLELERSRLYSETEGYEIIETQNSFSFALRNFFVMVENLLEESKPDCSPITNSHYQKDNKYPNKNGKFVLYDGHLRENYLSEPVRNKEVLSSYLKLSDDEVKALKTAHEKFYKKLPEKFPDEILEKSTFNRFMKGDGIVYLAGGNYNQLALLSIKILRSVGSLLPVEVIIPYYRDFDYDLCNTILPALNGHCLVMEDYLPKSFLDKVKGFQLKNIALLLSSYERILYLDADNLPTKNPDLFFINEPFISKHLVGWPDLWRRSISPHFYDIIDIKVNEKNKIRNSYFKGDKRGTSGNPSEFSFHDCEGTLPEASSETGQLLINKNYHFKTLLLSLYYNWYGPDYYYPLLSQGAAGEGDKETFVAAAHKLNLPYYQVAEFNREFGPMNLNTRKHEFFGMGQYDPIVDYIQSGEGNPDENKITYYNDAEPVYANNKEDSSKSNSKFHLFKSSNLAFLHANWPKYKIREMFLGNSYGRGQKSGDTRRRLYGKELIEELNGFDFELEINKNLKWCYCDLQYNLHDIPNYSDIDRQKICQEIDSQISFLKRNQ